jgi:hypothetical protein
MTEKRWFSLELLAILALVLAIAGAIILPACTAPNSSAGYTPPIMAVTERQPGVTVRYVGTMPKPEGLYVCSFMPDAGYTMSCFDWEQFMIEYNKLMNQGRSAGAGGE